jgi:hypothetical protein
MAVSKQWAMIRSWLRKTHNKEVHEFFKDLSPDQDPDNTSGRSTTKAVCLIGAGDSQGIAEIKMRNFEALKKKVGMDWQPVHDYELLPDITVEGKPQVQLWFWEKYSNAKRNNRQQARARVSFRIMDENWSTAEANSLALKIRDKFAKPIYSFEKGQLSLQYLNKKKAHNFRLTVDDKAEAKRVIEDVLDLLGETPNWDYLVKAESEKNFNEVQTTRVLGKTVKVSPQRPRTIVYFKYAIAKIPPLTTDFALVDTSGTYAKALYHESNPYLAPEPQLRSVRAKNVPLF